MGTYTPPPSPTYSDGAGGSETNGAFTAQANQSSLAGKNLLQAGSGATEVIGVDSGSNLHLNGVGGNITLGSTVAFANPSVSSFQGVGTAGLGLSAIYGATSPTHKTTAAPASTTYASPAAGFYIIKVSADVKTATTLSLTMKVTYTDSEGTAQSDVLVFCKEGSVTLLSAVVAADRYVAVHAICTNGATNIVVADNSGTYTTCDYYYAVSIAQEA